MRSVYLVAAILALPGCNPSPTTPSPISTRLEQELIPKIVEWSKSGKPTLPIYDAIPLTGYEAVCILPEYMPLKNLNAHRFGGVAKFYSDFGKFVPENHLAVIVIENHNAHAALLMTIGIPFIAEPDGTCVKAYKAVLHKTIRTSHRQTPVTQLEEE